MHVSPVTERGSTEMLQRGPRVGRHRGALGGAAAEGPGEWGGLVAKVDWDL